MRLWTALWIPLSMHTWTALQLATGLPSKKCRKPLAFLVFLCYFLSISFFSYLGPTTVDRSLSVFVYFYAVEENGIPENYQNERYFKDFTKRRLEDGIKTGMLSKEGNIYKPTIKSKILYGIFYPISVITGTDETYKKFKKSVKEKK